MLVFEFFIEFQGSSLICYNRIIVKRLTLVNKNIDKRLKLNPMANSLHKRICEARKSSGLSQAELSKKLNIHLTTLSKYENGHRLPDSDILSHIANICQVDPAWLLTGSDAPERHKSINPMPVDRGKPRTVSVPVHAFAGAGGPVEIWEHDPVEFVDVPAHWMKPNIQSAIIRGRSMEPTIVDGAVVGVNTEFKQIISGEMYALWMDYEGAIVKRLYVEKDVLRIVSDNKDFPEMQLGRDEINEESFILGKVSWLMQSY